MIREQVRRSSALLLVLVGCAHAAWWTSPTGQTTQASSPSTADKADIHTVVRSRLHEVRACDRRGAAREHRKLTLSFVVAPDGSVGAARVLESTSSDPALNLCVRDAALKWKFAAPDPAKPVVVTYPVLLNPTVSASGSDARQRGPVDGTTPIAGPLATEYAGYLEELAPLTPEQKAEAAACYESRRATVTTLRGTLAMRLSVDPEGNVTGTRIAASSVRDSTLEDCILQRALEWSFPKGASKDGNMRYLFRFEPSSRPAPVVADEQATR